MRLGTFLEKVKAALRSENCLHCEASGVPAELLFCRRCEQRLGLCRLPDAASGIHAAAILNAECKRLIYGYKFHDRKNFAAQLSGMLIQYWRSLMPNLPERGLHPENVLVVPIPPHLKEGPERQNDRNGVDGFAGRFARHFGYDYQPDALAWTRPVTPQHSLHEKRERLQNVVGGLQVRMPLSADYRLILVVDDLTTTGATLFEAMRAFDAAHAVSSNIEIIPLAIAKVPLGYRPG